jgi:hypothetical protein
MPANFSARHAAVFRPLRFSLHVVAVLLAICALAFVLYLLPAKAPVRDDSILPSPSAPLEERQIEDPDRTR